MTKMTTTRETYNNSCAGIVELPQSRLVHRSECHPDDHRCAVGDWTTHRKVSTRLGARVPARAENRLSPAAQTAV